MKIKIFYASGSTSGQREETIQRVDETVKHFILKYQKIRGPRIYKSYHNSINKR